MSQLEPMVEKFGIVGLVAKLMSEVELFVDFTGEQKKKYVIDQIKLSVRENHYEEVEDLVEMLIEFVIAISKNEYKLDINTIKKISTKCCTVLQIYYFLFLNYIQ